MKPCDKEGEILFCLSKGAVNVIQFVGKRRVVVGYGLQTMAYVLRVVGGEILLKFVPLFGLTRLGGIFRSMYRFLVFVFVIVFLRIQFRL